MAKSIIGLHIGARSIKAVELENPDKVSPTLKAFHEVALPEGAARDGEVLDSGLVILSLKQMFKEMKFGTKQVVLGVGNQRVLVRDVKLPKMNADDMREALPLQVEGLLPVSVEESVLDFYPIAEVDGKDGPEISGLLVAAIRDIVETNVKAVSKAELTPVAVDLVPFAIARLYNTQAVADETVALLHIGSSTSYTVIVRNQIPVFVRIIPIGGDSITETLRRELGVTFDEAEQIKRQYGINFGQHPEIDPNIRAGLTESVRQIIGSFKSTKDFFQYSNSSTPIGRILFSGGGTLMPGLAQQLQFELGAPGEFIKPYGHIKIGPKVDEQLAQSKAIDMVIPLGLAIGGER